MYKRVGSKSLPSSHLSPVIPLLDSMISLSPEACFGLVIVSLVIVIWKHKESPSPQYLPLPPSPPALPLVGNLFDVPTDDQEASFRDLNLRYGMYAVVDISCTSWLNNVVTHHRGDCLPECLRPAHDCPRYSQSSVRPARKALVELFRQVVLVHVFAVRQSLLSQAIRELRHKR